jgi:hypothetical protein
MLQYPRVREETALIAWCLIMALSRNTRAIALRKLKLIKEGLLLVLKLHQARWQVSNQNRKDLMISA